MLQAAIIGFGGIAAAHKNAYAQLEKEEKVKLVAAYDIRPEAFARGKAKINIDTGEGESASEIRAYFDLYEMLKNEKIDIIDICTPSYLHKKYALEMLERGYHVMCEKPMSLTFADCQEMLEAAKGAKGHLMIGQCVRFYPSYQYLSSCVQTEKYGKVTSGDFCRLSTTPDWGFEDWFLDTDKSGGCITDLHVHDIDIIRHIFGEPKAITALATNTVARYDSCHTALHYGDFNLFATGDWSLTNRPFEAGFRVSFEEATLALEPNGALMLYPREGGEPEEIKLPAFNAYAEELRYLCEVIEGKTENILNTPESAARSIYLTELIKESADSGKTVSL